MYNLKSRVIAGTSHEVDLDENLYEHLMPHTSKTYHVKFPKSEEGMEYEYVVSILQYSGSIEIINFKDENLT